MHVPDPPAWQSNSLANLAARIRAEHQAVLASHKTGAGHAMNAGDELIVAKAGVKAAGGKWRDWVKENFEVDGLSYRTCRLYMQLARRRPEIEAEWQRSATFSINAALAAIAPESDEPEGADDENDDDEADDDDGHDDDDGDDVNGMAYLRGDGDHDDGWYSPEPIVEAFRVLFGGEIDLDPFSCDEAQKVVKARRHFTKQDDAFKQSWHCKNLFMNPPYDRANIRPAVQKLIDEHRCGNVPEAGLLTSSNTGTRWWQAAAEAASAVCYPKGNLEYWHPAKGARRHPSRRPYFTSDLMLKGSANCSRSSARW
jgi:DNA N-6-adenine-methyltransferase (Dam)